MKALYLVMAVILLLVAAFFVNEGLSYVTYGHGVHPALATAAYLVSMACYVIVLVLFADCNEAPRLD